MSDLTRFRDHCYRMAGPPVAPGSPLARSRALWLQMAREIDEYLSKPTEHVDLFGEMATEPTMEEA